MTLHDYRNVRRTFRMLAAMWDCPVWAVKGLLRRIIDECWTRDQSNPEARDLWKQYFPEGKPTPTQYILRLGRAKETGEQIPYLLRDETESTGTGH